RVSEDSMAHGANDEERATPDRHDDGKPMTDAAMRSERPMRFSITSRDPSSAARTGLLELPHGTVETPVFMPVGTRAAVKAVTPDQLAATGARLSLANTYHLTLRPGEDVIREAGGLHRFMAWDGPILTDSGGYQVFSLSELNRVGDDGVVFQSHIDGQLEIG